MSEVITLSSGVKVRFNKLPAQMSQEIFTGLLADAKLNRDGTIKESTDPQENIKLLGKMTQYNRRLIVLGVELVGEIEDYYGIAVPDSKWLKTLVKADFVPSNYDLNDEDDVKALFLQFHGFLSADDWRLLSENTLNLPQ